MEINETLVAHLAQLSRLEFGPDEAKQIALDLEKMTNMIDKLSELDTAGVEPLRHISGLIQRDIADATRSDNMGEMLTNEEALREARHSHAPFFVVPKVISR